MHLLQYFLLGLVPLPAGWLYSHILAFFLNLPAGAFREAILYGLDICFLLLPWLAVYVGHTSRRQYLSRTLPLLVFLAPSVLCLACLFASGPLLSLGRIFFLPIQSGFLGLMLTEWQFALLDILVLTVAFLLGRHALSLEEYNEYFLLTLVILGVGLLQRYFDHLGENTGADIFISPLFVLTGLILQLLRLKLVFNILRDLFARRKG